ncbi:aspartate/glutamate racemase family protein [Mycolicibacterium sp. BiH015]|uniref:aspartate/glutamate racemase family protein n=1 Tax=Mycolicibacterium sp. BiH015 TaxID=3018808 RepID=UPI0022E32933|nr:aspartate/glutamate racemase family protein [Mycolicibacterium sp. BiH015]MDA2892604.1 aspartate/glutamate racemase family protein [Mycolicibacterium sp. BiH015]
MTHIVVMNCNTSESMTAEIGRHARMCARPGTVIDAWQPRWGPESAEGYYDSFITAAAVLDRLHELPSSVDAVVMAGFGEHGREGARELLSIPVVDITEAAAQFAMLLAPRYGVVTTLGRACAQIHDSLTTAGLMSRCAAIEAAELGVLDLETDPEAAVDAMHSAGRRAIDAGAEALALGCAGMTGMSDRLSAKLGVPVVDGVAAAVSIAESLVALSLCTSKIRTYATPRPKHRSGWPISKESGHTHV